MNIRNTVSDDFTQIRSPFKDSNKVGLAFFSSWKFRDKTWLFQISDYGLEYPNYRCCFEI